MTAAAALARAEAAGLRLSLRPDGGVRMEAAAPPPPDVLVDLRRWREDVAALLAARTEVEARAGSSARLEAEAAAALAAPDPELEAERAVMARHYAAPPEARPYVPGDPDALRDGLLLGWRDHRPAPP